MDWVRFVRVTGATCGGLILWALLGPGLVSNLRNVQVNRAWFMLLWGDRTSEASGLHDGLPPHWMPSNWGNGLALHDTRQAVVGTGWAAHIEKTTAIDFSVYSQTFEVSGPQEIECSVYHKGAAAFLEARGHGVKGQAFADLVKSDKWSYQSLEFLVEGSAEQITVVLGLGGVVGDAYFERASCVSGMQRRELILNGDFSPPPPALPTSQYWANTVGSRVSRYEQIGDGSAPRFDGGASIADVSRVTMRDLLGLNLDAVSKRAAASPAGCEFAGAAPLIGLGEEFQMEGNLDAAESQFHLIVDLMPGCPQGYASLGALYYSQRAYGAAAVEYQEALRRTGSNKQWLEIWAQQRRIALEGTGEFAPGALQTCDAQALASSVGLLKVSVESIQQCAA